MPTLRRICAESGALSMTGRRFGAAPPGGLPGQHHRHQLGLWHLGCDRRRGVLCGTGTETEAKGDGEGLWDMHREVFL
jgi:hypothetical protein